MKDESFWGFRAVLLHLSAFFLYASEYGGVAKW